jgi:hypothetical protein
MERGAASASALGGRPTRPKNRALLPRAQAMLLNFVKYGAVAAATIACLLSPGLSSTSGSAHAEVAASSSPNASTCPTPNGRWLNSKEIARLLKEHGVELVEYQPGDPSTPIEKEINRDSLSGARMLGDGRASIHYNEWGGNKEVQIQVAESCDEGSAKWTVHLRVERSNWSIGGLAYVATKTISVPDLAGQTFAIEDRGMAYPIRTPEPRDRARFRYEFRFGPKG